MSTDLPQTPLPVLESVLPPARPPRHLGDVMEEAYNCLKAMERAGAGYQKLMGAYKTVTQQLEPGERQQGLPILEFPGSHDGVHSTQVAVNLARLTPSEQIYVLVPLISCCSADMREAAEGLLGCAKELAVITAAAIPANGQQ